jgi:predicted HTH domain antitoxin
VTTLEIKVPDDLDLASGSSREELTGVARLLFALHLFKLGKVTAAQAATMSGLSWRQLLAEAAAQGIPSVSWDDEELDAERLVVAEGQ